MNKIIFLRKILDNSEPEALDILLSTDILDFFYETFLIFNFSYNIEPFKVFIKDNEIEKVSLKVNEDNIDEILKMIKVVNKNLKLSHQKTAKLTYSKNTNKNIIFIKIKEINKELLY